jgi:HD superfamily phosphohydrolase
MRIRHEVRDPIYGFVEYNNLERDIINSLAYQRLRNVHQLALTSLIYPGATHKRFEHCLGVMQVSSDVFDKVFEPDALSGPVADQLKGQLSGQGRQHWRQVVRIAALLHDVGHLPFSHAAEKELLPEGWDHERMTAEFIRNSEIADILKNNDIPIPVEHVIDLAWQPSKRQKHEPDKLPDVWRTLLNEIITGDTFGTDRIDYLLRDAYHAGVAYGRFDVHRLINGLTVELDEAQNPILAIDYGSIHAAEALLLLGILCILKSTCIVFGGPTTST